MAQSFSSDEINKLLRTVEPHPQPPATIFFRFHRLTICLLMLALPLLYSGLIASVIYCTWWHITNNFGLIFPRGFNGRAASIRFLIYIVPIVAGVGWTISLLKPLFPKQKQFIELWPEEEPAVYQFFQQLAERLGTPRPDIIRLVLPAEVTLSYKAPPMMRATHKTTLTIGVPLIHGLTLSQLTGIVTSQLSLHRYFTRSFCTRTIYQVNQWFYAAQYDHDPMRPVMNQYGDPDNSSERGAVSMVFTWLTISFGCGIIFFLRKPGLMLSHKFMTEAVQQAEQEAAHLIGSTEYVDALEKSIGLTIASSFSKRYFFNYLQGKEQPEDFSLFTAMLAEQSQVIPKLIHKQNSCKQTEHFLPLSSINQRVQLANQIQTTGHFNNTASSKSLFEQLEKHGKGLTGMLYEKRFGSKSNQNHIHPTEQAVTAYLNTMEK